MFKTKEIFLTILIPALSVISPILWDMYSNPYALTFFQHSQSVIVQKNVKIDRVKVLYDGKEVDQVVNSQYSIENTGWKAIEKADVLKAIGLLTHDAKILSVNINRTEPPKIDALTTYSNNLLNIDFQLLNKKEKIFVDVLTDRIPSKIEPIGRIKNVSVLDFRNYVSKPQIYKKAAFYVGVASFIMLVLTIYVGRSINYIRRNAYYFLNNTKVGFDKECLKMEIEELLGQEFTQKQKDSLTSEVDATDPNDSEQVRKLSEKICYEGLNRDPSGSLAIGVILWALILVYSIVSVTWYAISI